MGVEAAVLDIALAGRVNGFSEPAAQRPTVVAAHEGGRRW